MQLTYHASQRSSQRHIPAAVVAAIYDFGTDYASRGATGLRLDRRAIDLAADELEPYQIERLRRFSGTYIIADGAHVITVAHAIRRKSN